MLRVLIADDEQNICLMIRKLVNWSEYGMEVIALAHNGLEAMSVIEQQRPEVVISDIRMPGYDGLALVQRARDLGLATDFVIISGYKQFEYAHTALNLGVEHYLLKPIDRQELEQTLSRIAEKHQVNKLRREQEKELKQQARNSRQQIRRHFLTEIMEQSGGFHRVQHESAQLEYGFDQGCFVAILAKLDSNDPQQDISGILHMVNDMIDHDFYEGRSEYINSTVNSGIMTMLNYKPEDRHTVGPSVERTHQRILKELEKFRGFHFTVGVGAEKSSLSEAAETIREAAYAVKCREKAGLDRVIYYEKLRYQPVDIGPMLEDTRRELGNMVVSLDFDALRGLVMKYAGMIQAAAFGSPVSMYDYLEGVVEIIARAMEQNQIEEAVTDKLKNDANRQMDYYVDGGEMTYRVLETVRQCFEQLMSERKNRSQRPIRMAREYIQQHYSQQVSLEEVAEAIGLSSAYLSTMFKKEMGISFSDCLISCRMEAARELLKNSDLSMAEIAEQVGYADAKYFSKTFHKVVGLKPSVYRKMYC